MRGDEGHVRAGSATRASRVDERRLEKRAVFAVESACAGLEVRNRGGERAVASVCAASGENATALDQGGLV